MKKTIFSIIFLFFAIISANAENFFEASINDLLNDDYTFLSKNIGEDFSIFMLEKGGGFTYDFNGNYIKETKTLIICKVVLYQKSTCYYP